MKLKEVKLNPPGGSYASEFFAEVATKEAGKLFQFDAPTSRNSLSTQAATYGKRLGVRFTVRTVPPAKEGDSETFAVGVSDAPPRERKSAKVEEIQPALETWPAHTGNPEDGVLQIGYLTVGEEV